MYFNCKPLHNWIYFSCICILRLWSTGLLSFDTNYLQNHKHIHPAPILNLNNFVEDNEYINSNNKKIPLITIFTR